MRRRRENWVLGWWTGWINGFRNQQTSSRSLSNNPFIHQSIHPFLRVLACCAGLALVAGCAGYQLGPTNGVIAGDKKIRITPFLNHTLEPRLGDAVTTAVRQRIQEDGTYRLSTRGDADILVTGVVTKYLRHELNFVPHDVLTVQDYRVSVTAQITARDLSTGHTTNWTNTAYTLVRVGSDLTSAERQAMPVLADELAKNVTDSLVDGSW
jgi:Lipopolysaccharide-assembly